MEDAKYFTLLEKLEFNSRYSVLIGNNDQHKKREEKEAKFKKNLEVLRNYFGRNVNDIIEELCLRMEIEMSKIIVANDKEEYIVLMLQVLSNGMDFNINKKGLIPTHNTEMYMKAVEDLVIHAFSRQLHFSFYKSEIFKENYDSDNINFALLRLSLICFGKFISTLQLHIHRIEFVIRDFIAAVFTLKTADRSGDLILSEGDKKILQSHLDYTSTHLCKLVYFRNLMLLNGTPDLPIILRKMLHQALLHNLVGKNGFKTLVSTMHSTQVSDCNDKQLHEVVANIVAFPGHSHRLHHSMINQVFEFCYTCLKNKAMLNTLPIGIFTIRRLYDLNVNNQERIVRLVEAHFKEFFAPEDLLSGLIVLDHEEICTRINLLYQMFCISTVSCLPSILLVNFLPLLLQLYDSFPEAFTERKMISALISRCLDNRDPKKELPVIVERLYTSSFATSWRSLHQRLIIVTNEKTSQINLKVIPSNDETKFNAPLILPNLLMSQINHMLTYKVFMVLMNMTANKIEQSSAKAVSTELIYRNEEELNQFLSIKYSIDIEILLSLNALITHQPLKMLFGQNIKDFVQLLSEMIQKRLLSSPNDASYIQRLETTILVLLTLLQELLEHLASTEENRFLLPKLAQLSASTSSTLIKERTTVLTNLLNCDVKKNTLQDSAFQTARSLIESNESHLQVYGIQMLINLLNSKDIGTLSEGHRVLALAMFTLRSKESYTFLNSVRLFVTLVQVMETEVLYMLEGEYLSESADIDYRLVVGEAILKVCNELGPICYKYKDELIKCFINGARSKLDEFRTSAFSNLAKICRILKYEVQKFFQELLEIVKFEIISSKYVPAKRAAFFVLCELFEGMDNLMDFEDMLIPIYRLLRCVEMNENYDETMRLHASNGLTTLSSKCRQILFPEQDLKKEIRILGLSDKPKRKSQHILELN